VTLWVGFACCRPHLSLKVPSPGRATHAPAPRLSRPNSEKSPAPVGVAPPGNWADERERLEPFDTWLVECRMRWPGFWRLQRLLGEM
jgi:hypothetical protein